MRLKGKYLAEWVLIQYEINPQYFDKQCKQMKVIGTKNKKSD